MIDLKPCPFCGDSLTQDPRHPDDYWHPNTAECILRYQRFLNLDIAAWNRRVPPTMEAVLSIEVVANLWDEVARLLNLVSGAGYGALFDRTLRPVAAKFIEACVKENHFVWCRAVATAGYIPGGTP